MPDYHADFSATQDQDGLYRQLVMKLHPDRGGSTEEFKAMQSAYETVKAAAGKAQRIGQEIDKCAEFFKTEDNRKQLAAGVILGLQTMPLTCVLDSSWLMYRNVSVIDAIVSKFDQMEEAKGHPNAHLLWDKTVTILLRIQQRVFSRAKRNGQLTAPSTILLKSSTEEAYGFDILIAVETGPPLSIGLVRRSKIPENLIHYVNEKFGRRGYVVELPNQYWDFAHAYPAVETEGYRDKADEVLQRHLAAYRAEMNEFRKTISDV
jgi:hypothetical protein